MPARLGCLVCFSPSSSSSTGGSAPVGVRRHFHQTLPALSVHVQNLLHRLTTELSVICEGFKLLKLKEDHVQRLECRHTYINLNVGILTLICKHAYFKNF